MLSQHHPWIEAKLGWVIGANSPVLFKTHVESKREDFKNWLENLFTTTWYPLGSVPLYNTPLESIPMISNLIKRRVARKTLRILHRRVFVGGMGLRFLSTRLCSPSSYHWNRNKLEPLYHVPLQKQRSWSYLLVQCDLYVYIWSLDEPNFHGKFLLKALGWKLDLQTSSMIKRYVFALNFLWKLRTQRTCILWGKEKGLVENIILDVKV